MKTEDYVKITLACIGWIGMIVQFFLLRKHHKQDKILEKRYEVYSNFMNTIDETNRRIRTDPQMVFGAKTELMTTLLSGDDEDINNALAKFNEELVAMSNKSIEPLLVVNQELNKLKLVCSDKMLFKIDEYKKLLTDYCDEFQMVLTKTLANNDFDVTAQKLGSDNYRAVNESITTLGKEIETMMRDEVKYYNRQKKWK